MAKGRESMSVREAQELFTFMRLRPPYGLGWGQHAGAYTRFPRSWLALQGEQDEGLEQRMNETLKMWMKQERVQYHPSMAGVLDMVILTRVGYVELSRELLGEEYSLPPLPDNHVE
jgi:hypothetical protein